MLYIMKWSSLFRMWMRAAMMVLMAIVTKSSRGEGSLKLEIWTNEGGGWVGGWMGGSDPIPC